MRERIDELVRNILIMLSVNDNWQAIFLLKGNSDFLRGSNAANRS